MTTPATLPTISASRRHHGQATPPIHERRHAFRSAADPLGTRWGDREFEGGPPVPMSVEALQSYDALVVRPLFSNTSHAVLPSDEEGPGT